MDRWIITDLNGKDVFDAKCEVINNFISDVFLNGTYVVRRLLENSQIVYLVKFEEYHVKDQLETNGVVSFPGYAIVPVTAEFDGEVSISSEHMLNEFAKQYCRKFNFIGRFGDKTECEFHHELSGSRFEIIMKFY